MTVRRPVRLVLPLLLAVVATVLSAGTASSRGDAMTGAPEVGSCYVLTPTQAAGDSLPAPVACEEEHNHWVIGVKQAPRDLEFTPNESLFAFAGTACAAGQKKFSGTNLRAIAASAYGTFVFIPTRAQRAQGARWVACTIAILNSERPSPLSTEIMPPKPDRLPLPDSLARCLDRKGFALACAEPHRFRAVPAPGIYRGRMSEQRAEREAERRCDRVTAGYRGRYSMRTPAPQRHVLLCYLSTRS